MNQEQKRSALQRAIRIGDDLLSAGKIFQPGSDYQPFYSSPLFFLTELYKFTGRTDFRERVLEQAGSVGTSAGFNPEYIYFLLACYEMENEPAWLDLALKLTEERCRADLYNESLPNGLFGGRAGYLLLLLHVHAASARQWPLLLANHYAGQLLKLAFPSTGGLYWADDHTNVRADCGLGYGTAGICLAFLELARYTGNREFLLVARKVALFEEEQWKQDIENWPCYRKTIKTEEDYRWHRQQYKNGDYAFFLEANDDTGFSYGTLGIGLVRARGWQLSGMEVFQKGREQALHKLHSVFSKAGLRSNVLHASTDFGILLTEFYRITEASGYLARAMDTLRTLENTPGCSPEQQSSIGLLCLRILSPSPPLPVPRKIESSPLAYELSNYPFLAITGAEVRQITLRKDYPRTVYLLEHVAPSELTACFQSQSADSERQSLHALVSQRSPGEKWPFTRELTALYHLESIKVSMGLDIQSGAWQHMADIAEMEEVETSLNKARLSWPDAILSIRDTVCFVQLQCCALPDLHCLPEDNFLPDCPSCLVALKATTRALADLESLPFYRYPGLPEPPPLVAEFLLTGFQEWLTLHLQTNGPLSVAQILTAARTGSFSTEKGFVLESIITLVRKGILKIA
ncbi:MAG: hypothetical protein JST68_26025 [Bacteroidetes bacterium]|nr:hypothetical protein [Bacteroidota bacterium]